MVVSLHIVSQVESVDVRNVQKSALAAQSAEIEQLRQRIAAIDTAAAHYVADGRPDNTKRAYESDWRVWNAFCEAIGVPPLTYSPGLLVAFVAYLEKGDEARGVRPAAPNTIRRRLSGAVVMLRHHGVTVPKDGSKPARDAVDAVERHLAEANEKRGRGQAKALLVDDVVHICDSLPDTLAGHRDRALLLVGFAIGARRDELARLQVDDLTVEDRGLLVHVRTSKTGIHRDPNRVPYGRQAISCPVRAWLAWLRHAGLTDGPAFRRVDRHGNVGGGMTGQAVGQAVERMAARAGLAFRFTGHSLRAGMATSARRAGHDQHAISRQGRWSPTSNEVARYIREEDGWTDNALNDIGL